jgi:hypothetical protein
MLRYRFTDMYIDIGDIGPFFDIGYRYRSKFFIRYIGLSNYVTIFHFFCIKLL